MQRTTEFRALLTTLPLFLVFLHPSTSKTVRTEQFCPLLARTSADWTLHFSPRLGMVSCSTPFSAACLRQSKYVRCAPSVLGELRFFSLSTTPLCRSSVGMRNNVSITRRSFLPQANLRTLGYYNLHVLSAFHPNHKQTATIVVALIVEIRGQNRVCAVQWSTCHKLMTNIQ
jgi:hypothetical protein